MDEYVSKPISMDELKEVLGQWLRFEAPGAAPDADAVDLSQLRVITGGFPGCATKPGISGTFPPKSAPPPSRRSAANMRRCSAT